MQVSVACKVEFYLSGPNQIESTQFRKKTNHRKSLSLPRLVPKFSETLPCAVPCSVRDKHRNLHKGHISSQNLERTLLELKGSMSSEVL